MPHYDASLQPRDFDLKATLFLVAWFLYFGETDS